MKEYLMFCEREQILRNNLSLRRNQNLQYGWIIKMLISLIVFRCIKQTKLQISIDFLIMDQKQLVSQTFNSAKTFFPSIPSPRNRRNNLSLLMPNSINRTLSPKSISNSVIKEGSNITKQQKVVSNFLLKYLSRKQTQQLKWNSMNKCEQTVAVKSQKRMDPKFRRVYLKKIKGEKKDLISRFIIGNQSNYSQTFFKNSLTIQS